MDCSSERNIPGPNPRLTLHQAERKIAIMKRQSKLAALLLAVAFAASTLPAQRHDRPSRDFERESGGYVTQPAWKSVEVGDFYLKRKSYRAALSRYKEAAKVDPYFPQAYLGMGKVYDRLGLRQKALKNYQKYLALLPSSKQAEEAREVHQAIARLQSKLKSSKFPPKPHSSVESSTASD